MCSGPALLCLDEPAAGLNPKESGELATLLRLIRDEHDTSILIIEHDMSVVMNISDHVVVLDYGALISDGPPDYVRNDANVIAAYLGVADAAEAEQVVADIAREAQGLIGAPGRLQMLFRIGHAKPVMAAPRRGLEAHLA